MSRTNHLLSIALILGIAFCLASSTARAQAAPSADANAQQPDDYRNITDQDIDLLRQNLRSQRKQLIAANMPLTSTEAEKFWPVYDQYIAELVAMNRKKYDLIKQYLQSGGNMPDAQAESAVKQWIDVDRSVSDLRLKYVPQFSKVLTPRKTAIFYQIDRRVQLMIDLQLASALPLLEP